GVARRRDRAIDVGLASLSDARDDLLAVRRDDVDRRRARGGKPGASDEQPLVGLHPGTFAPRTGPRQPAARVATALRVRDPERAPQAAVEKDEGGLVPSVRHVLLHAGAEPPLDAFAQPEILPVDRVDRELEVRRPVAYGLLGRRRFGDVE